MHNESTRMSEKTFLDRIGRYSQEGIRLFHAMEREASVQQGGPAWREWATWRLHCLRGYRRALPLGPNKGDAELAADVTALISALEAALEPEEGVAA